MLSDDTNPCSFANQPIRVVSELLPCPPNLGHVPSRFWLFMYVSPICFLRAFIWNREFGGTAYEWTLAGLQRRLYTALDGDAPLDTGDVRYQGGTAS